MLGSKVPAPGIGFSIGEDRLVMAVEESQAPPALDLFIAPLGEAALRHAGVLARDLRREGIGVELATDGKLKRAMELANKLGARYTLIIGDNEIAAGQYALKNMLTGEQQSVTASNIKTSICNQASH
jgi:histidyl-tRNA synthetase